MPRLSNRRRIICQLSYLNDRQRRYADLRFICSESDSFEDSIDLLYESLGERIECTRYTTRTDYRKREGRVRWDKYLNENSILLNNDEFLRLFRMSRNSFKLLMEEIGDSPAFKNAVRFKKARPAFQQVLVFSYYVGRYGSSGACNEVAIFFGIGSRSVLNYVNNTIKALKAIKDEVVYWPSEVEREEMKTHLSSTGFRHCVGIADGTLIVLLRKPRKYHECYFSRKSCYAINALVVCDDRCRIIYYYTGWPGSTHDNRVIRNSKLYKEKEKYFGPMEYLLGDSAYSSNSVMVQSFKKARNEVVLPRDKELFNTHLASIRIKSEHCIGILKGRFQILKGMNIWINNGKKEVKQIVDIFTCCCVLHNLMINYDDIIPQEWYEDLNEQIDFTAAEEIENQLYQNAIQGRGICDGDRRTSVFHTIMEFFG